VDDAVNDVDLGPVVAAARHDPAFLAGRVSLAGAERAIAAQLDLDQRRLQRLLLCRPPLESRFATDVHAIADLVGVQPGQLAAALREVDAVGALHGVHQQLHFGRAGVLAAARDISNDHVTPTTEHAERLRELAARFWSAAPDHIGRERDVAAAIAWSARLAVVALSPLTLRAIRQWLSDRNVPVSGDLDGSTVRGFLVAWRGIGVVFFDGTLDSAERRFTLAHEVGHFLLDYDEPRQRVLRDAPELLEVVDSVRPLTASDRAQALLARVPVGVHTHLLEYGGSSQDDFGADDHAEDEASRFALELLAPWAEVLELTRDAVQRPAPYQHVLAREVELLAAQFALPPYAARSRAQQALDELGIRPGFFDR
jgi:Zn-dependent peptidase ImmA (M78 family)